jgi:c-di-GMP-related signal transduction protein
MDFCIAKQPVVDRSGNLAGYELLYRRAPSDNIAIIKSHINPTDHVLSGYFLLNIYSYDMDGTTYFINCDEEDMYNKNITMLPPHTTY